MGKPYQNQTSRFVEKTAVPLVNPQQHARGKTEEPKPERVVWALGIERDGGMWVISHMKLVNGVLESKLQVADAGGRGEAHEAAKLGLLDLLAKVTA